VLVEKLLRSCPELDTIYLLLRPKKGHSVEERLDEFRNSPVGLIDLPFCVGRKTDFVQSPSRFSLV
jgi:Male sterility protein